MNNPYDEMDSYPTGYFPQSQPNNDFFYKREIINLTKKLKSIKEKYKAGKEEISQLESQLEQAVELIKELTERIEKFV